MTKKPAYPDRIGNWIVTLTKQVYKEDIEYISYENIFKPIKKSFLGFKWTRVEIYQHMLRFKYECVGILYIVTCICWTKKSKYAPFYWADALTSATIIHKISAIKKVNSQ